MLAKEFITEKRKKKSKKKKLGRYFFPGFSYYGLSGSGDSSEGGGDGGGGESLREGSDLDIENEVNRFSKWAGKKLYLKNIPKITLSNDTEEAQGNHHTGGHMPGSGEIWVYAKNRNLVDMLRTVFHELVHVRQEELGMIKPGSSYPGSPIEAMADMLAGKYIKIYGKANRNIFQ